jgi:exoribonuclease-2
LVRADHLPLMLSVMGAAGLVRGDKVKVQLGSIDAMALDVTGTVIEKIISSDHSLDAENASADELMEDLEEAATGPIAIAMNVNETPTDDPSA